MPITTYKLYKYNFNDVNRRLLNNLIQKLGYNLPNWNVFSSGFKRIKFEFKNNKIYYEYQKLISPSKREEGEWETFDFGFKSNSFDMYNYIKENFEL